MGQAVPPMNPGIYDPDAPCDVVRVHGPLVVERPVPPGKRGLRRTARALGSTAATVVHRARHLPERVQELKNQVLAGAIRVRVKTSNKTNELTRQAKQQVWELRAQARRSSRRNPLSTLALAGIAGLALGIGLRLWRNHRG